MNSRLEFLRTRLKAKNIEGMIISNPVSIKYLIGINAEGILLLTRKENIYITDSRYIEMVKSVLTIDDEIIVTNIKDVSEEDYQNFFIFCENVGFEENYVTYAKYKEYMQKYRINNFVETDGIIEKQRVIKDDDEISNIKKACEITDKCFDYLIKYIKVGMTEKEIAFEIQKFFMANGADGLAFDSIVASGINSSKPHAVPTDRKIQKGDIITIDMGCKYNGYCSDMTRTIFVSTVQESVKSIYNLVLKNQKETLERIYEGANAKILFQMVDNNFKDNRFELSHALGHGVGLDIHECPVLGAKSERLLERNMVITDEPGIYIPGKFGIRIEDTVLVTKNGYEVLTKANKEIVILKV